jgi:glycosyltransferase involved in cell wall biosynthesis
MTLRVLNVLFDERVGGPQLRVLQVAPGLRVRDIETFVLMPKGDRAFSGLLRESGISHRLITMKRPRAGLNPRQSLAYLAWFWPTVLTIRSIIRSERIDIVHTNGLIHWQAAVAAKSTGTPLLWHLNDVADRGPLTTVGRAILRRTADGVAVAAGAVAIHNFGRLEHPRIPTWVVHAPVDVRRFDPAVRRSGNGGPVIGNIGNVNPVKGHRYLIEAAKVVVREYPDTRFQILGAVLENRRSLYEALQNEVRRAGLEQNVAFLGGSEDVPGFLGGLDVYVSSSLAEACPMAVLEAMAAQLPIVATDVGGTRELVPDGVAGRLSPRADGPALGRAIVELLNDRPLADRLAAEARKRAETLFDLPFVVDAHERAYRALVSSQTPSTA